MYPHVLHGADEAVGAVGHATIAAAAILLCKPKVGQTDVALRIQQHVLRLQVSVGMRNAGSLFRQNMRQRVIK